MKKYYIKLISRFNKEQRGASHFLEIAGGLILVAAIVSLAVPSLTASIKSVIDKAISQITTSF